MMQSLTSYTKRLALLLSPALVAVGGEAFDRVSNRAGRGHKGRAQKQPFGPGLFARMTVSSLGRVSTYTPSFFLVMRANSSRREVLGI